MASPGRRFAFSLHSKLLSCEESWEEQIDSTVLFSNPEQQSEQRGDKKKWKGKRSREAAGVSCGKRELKQLRGVIGNKCKKYICLLSSCGFRDFVVLDSSYL